MFVILGIVAVMGAVLVGYLMHGGNMAVLIQVNEIIIIGGAGFGSFLAANGMKNVKASLKVATGLMKPDPYTKQAYLDLFKMMYQLFNVARKEGLLGLERHVENPEKSDIIGRYPTFLGNHHAVNFFCDTMKVILTGAVGPHDLAEMMELDLEVAHTESKVPVEAFQTVGDAMPGFGIVAAVLGVIITMGKIGGNASEIGESVAAALVGTFLGILLAYGVFGPLSRALELRLKTEEQFLNCIRFALFSFARGESPITCVEFARRNVEPSVRPGFAEMEKTVKEKAAA
ncbi:MAG: flagellar motor stator protein MotA [Fimbriimonas ginsengisoli]|uniref:Flagellar motor stator protein MotA n=1 Tax=Fimbriimonas ginsengisoli TaxID=1005039 RepID=A0A931PWB4_FIMGI|nr:flagellar motor stator protein MotA [Fimbriimonas ginsengisoli]